MGMMDRLKASDEDFIKKFDDSFFEFSNDDELRGEVFFARGQMKRIQDNLDALEAEFTRRDVEFPATKSETVDESATKAEEDSVEGSAHSLEGTAGDQPFIAFVGASPSKLDMVRGQHFTGPVGKTLKNVYFPSVKAGRSDVLLTTVVKHYVTDDNGQPRVPTEAEMEASMPELREELAKYGIKFVVGLGKEASEALRKEGILDEFVPHPRAVNIYGDKGEVGRKLARLAKRVEKKADIEPKIVPDGPKTLQVMKAEEEKQYVLGVVIEPEVEDTDGNWTNPDEIEKTAHDFMLRSQQMGVEHVFKADDVAIVESYLAPMDFDIDGEPVKKGSWLLGALVLNEEKWEMVKSGDFAGFSFGGTAKIDPTQRL